MVAGKDFVYVRKNDKGVVQMFTDEQCKDFYVNSVIYKEVCGMMNNVPNMQIEIYYI